MAPPPCVGIYKYQTNINNININKINIKRDEILKSNIALAFLIHMYFSQSSIRSVFELILINPAATNVFIIKINKSFSYVYLFHALHCLLKL